MVLQTKKFSEFLDGGDLGKNNITVGLESGTNAQFDNPWVFLPPGTTADRPAPSAAINYLLRFNTDLLQYEYYDADGAQWVQLSEDSFTPGPLVIYEADAAFPDAFNLGGLTSGILKQTVSFGVATPSIASIDVDYYGPGMIGYLEAPAGVKDIDGNIIVGFNTNGPSSVNYVILGNSTAGNPVSVQAQGASPNIQLNLDSKGDAPIQMTTAALISPLVIYSGTASQHSTAFEMANTATNRTVTWQDGDGTVAFLSDVAGTVTSAEGTEDQILVNGTFGTAETGAIVLTLPQDIDITSSPTFNALTLTSGTIFDSNGNIILEMLLNPSAVNHLALNNSTTGNAVELGVLGTDPNIGMLYRAKADGQHLFLSTSSSPIVFASGTANQHTTVFTFANTAATRTATFPDASGTVVLENSNTFTPVITSSGGGAATYTTQTGNYSDIGDRRFFSLRIVLSNNAGVGAGTLTVTGFPSGNATASVACAIWSDDLQATEITDIQAKILSGTNSIVLSKYAAGANTQMDNNSLTATTEFIISGSYPI